MSRIVITNYNILVFSILIDKVSSMSASSYATEFNVAFLRQYSFSGVMEMLIYTMSSSPVQFNISSLTGTYSYTGTTSVHSPDLVTIPSSLQVREVTHSYRNFGLHVKSLSGQPISIVLIGHINTPRSTYLALPCYEQYTQEYIYYGISASGTSSVRYSQILLVGCRDNTTVTITPTQNVQLPSNAQTNSTLVNITAGSSHTITLHSLQTLLIAATLVDLSGTKIVSNHPLTVVGGHDCARVPVPYGDCDPLSTQIPPTINWGTHFLLTPLYSRNGQRFKLIVSENITKVSISCPQNNTNVTMNFAGDIITFDTNFGHFCYVLCSSKCYIAALAFGRDYPVNGYGDPLLMTVPPIRQYPHNVTFTTLPEMPTNHYSIAIPADTYYNGTVVINGTLTTLDFTPIYDMYGTIIGYGYNTTVDGNYTISHSHPNGKIYVSVYGFFFYGGYGYLAGMLLKGPAGKQI